MDCVPAYQPCLHVVSYRLQHGPHPFRCLRRVLRSGPFYRSQLAVAADELPRCTLCGSSHGRLYACLSCAAIGCSSLERQHAKEHAQLEEGHHLAVDLDRAELFCATCNDQQYDAGFDLAVLCNQAASCTVHTLPEKPLENATPTPLPASTSTRKRKRPSRALFEPWTPTAEESKKLKEHSSPIAADCPGDIPVPLGLRGLNNLGNTCFMNSVLQALLHTPPIRNYFLADCHNRAECQQRGPPHLCLSCDMDTMFAAAFSGVQTPFSPSHFLYSWWRHAENLAGYEQQDAHEFFISTVDGIHANACPSFDSFHPHRSGPVECGCMVHRVFSGLLRSDVTCSACGFTSTTHDPCVDISLDLDTAPTSPPQTAELLPPVLPPGQRTRSAAAANKNGNRTSRSASPHPQPANGSAGLHGGKSGTLGGCLDRFTRAERLGSSEKFFCERCQKGQESVKQMSVHRLPLVLCFHLKRFEHSSTRKTSRKLTRHISFPIDLNMDPYLSSTIVRLRRGNRIPPSSPPPQETQHSPSFDLSGGRKGVGVRTRSASGKGRGEPTPGSNKVRGREDGRGGGREGGGEGESEYEVFAVVSHVGSLESGHYVSYLRLQGEWYKCDDAWVTHVEERVVRAAEVYMLYYCATRVKYGVQEGEGGGRENGMEEVGATDAGTRLGFASALEDFTPSSSQVNGCTDAS